MLLSMTGFGKASATYKEYVLEVEVRSLNSKHLDFYFKLPQKYRSKEIALRKAMGGRLFRGKVDLQINLDGNIDQGFTINLAAVKRYVEDLKSLCTEIGIAEDQALSAAMRIPDATRPARDNIKEEEWQLIETTVDKAIDALVAFRLQEGKAMSDDLMKRKHSILSALKEIEEKAPERIERIKTRLRTQLRETIGMDKVDENRFEQELIYYLEKIDINEEIVRLRNHCDYFEKILSNSNNMKGKQLGFVAQEMGREINTIGSKANSAAIQVHVIRMKDDLEKIKEQVLNVV